jgi:two-component system NarL family sensor kinase
VAFGGTAVTMRGPWSGSQLDLGRGATGRPGAFRGGGGQDGPVLLGPQRKGRSTGTVSRAAPPRIGSAVARFLVGSLVAAAVVVVGGYFALRSVAITQAERNTRQLVEVEGRLVSSQLTDGVLRRDPRALARLDDVVAAQVLPPSVVKGTPPIVRVKIWSAGGTILYSDVPELVGMHFGLGADEVGLLRTGGAQADLSDLAKPENRFERQFGKLLEAHTPIRTPNGTPLLFEIYQKYSSVDTSARQLLGALAPPLLGGLAVLLLFQLPLAWSMGRGLQRGHHEREALLASAIEASERERGRIASDLHDGVVQDVAGVAFGLAPLATAAEQRGARGEADALNSSMRTLRQGVRDLRTLLVEIHPPSLESAGLHAALSDLLSPLRADGIATELLVADEAAGGSGADALVYRVAHEALRNVKTHAGAATVRVEVTRPTPRTTRLVVADDGRGFAAGEPAARAGDGHVGLSLLADLVRQSGGTLDVRSSPGRGTTVQLEVPAP